MRRARPGALAGLGIAIAGALMAGCIGGEGGGGADGGFSLTDGPEETDASSRCAVLPDEPEPNDSRERATPYTLGVNVPGCIASQTDRDYFALAVPTDPAGGFVVIALSEVGGGALSARVYAASDGGEVTSQFASTAGQTLKLFFAAAPGQAYRLEVRDFAGFTGPYTYRLQAAFTKVTDAFEPNDSRAGARPITVGTAVSASLFAGFASGNTVSAAAYDDWYSLNLRAGAVTVKLEEVPSSIAPDVTLFNGQGSEIGRKFDASKGASATVQKSVAAGAHFVKVAVFAPAPPAEGRGDALPEHFTRPYKLTVTQP